MNADEAGQDVERLERLHFDASQVFTPSSPIDSNELFAGRKQQVTAIIDAINQSGQHAALYGERGVGKTSLANVIVGFWHRSHSIIAPRINCLSTDTYDDVWRRAFNEIKTTQESRTAGFRGDGKRVASTVSLDIGDKAMTPDLVRSVLTAVGKEVILVIFFDEFDALLPSVRHEMAESVKMLSDYNVPATLVFVGVADSVNDLLRDHRSIERALIQVLMPRMPATELKQIVEKGLAKLEMTIDPSALSRITELSLGLPHYTHLISLHAVRESLDRAMFHVDDESVEQAIVKALSGAQQSLIDKYNLAITSAQRNHLFRQVLAACALAEVDAAGYFTPAAVRAPLSRIMGKPYDVPSYVRHLNEFSEEKRGRILQRIGEDRNHRFRFTNPLMQPYVLMKAKQDGFNVF